MSSEIKTINISGSAVSDISGSKKKRSTKRKQEGGNVHGVSSNIMNIVKGVETQSIASTSASTNPSNWLKYQHNAPVPPTIKIDNHLMQQTQPMQQTQNGGNIRHIKVELKKKQQTKKVHLNPKQADAPKHLSKKNQTKKSRKVTLGISNLHKRITRAKKLHKKVKEMPLETLKETLIKGGFIKPTSKAPESVLRQIAADAEVVKNKAL